MENFNQLQDTRVQDDKTPDHRLEYYEHLTTKLFQSPSLTKLTASLAEHYGFTDEELDFIINYDIKYRMGL